MTNVERFNEQSIGEEIANAITHGIGAALAIAGTVCIVQIAAAKGEVVRIVSGSLYGFSLIFLYLMSTLYHSIQIPKAKKVLQVFDHCSIFLLILGCYIPISLVLVRGWRGWALFGFNTAVALFGIVVNAISVKRWHKLSLGLYLLMGWSVMVVLKPMISLVAPLGFVLLVSGGVLYSIGVLFYKAKKPRFMHMIWHFFVMSGSILHFFFMRGYVI